MALAVPFFVLLSKSKNLGNIPKIFNDIIEVSSDVLFLSVKKAGMDSVIDSALHVACQRIPDDKRV